MLDLPTLIGTRLPRAVAPFIPQAAWRIPTSERVAYFTFDDGPSIAVTQYLLDILEAADARATFMLVGSHVQQCPELARAIVAAGHTVGNHSLTHPYPWSTSAHVFNEELCKTNHILQDVTATSPEYIRPPYGQLTPSMLRFAREHQQRILMWDLAPADFLLWVDAEQVREHILRFIRPGSIIVLHDNPLAADALLPVLPPLLQELSSEGWRFEAL